MTLDFTNYTFCGLISLLAAILGIGYPLFLESIRKIDEQYDSTRLSARFQRERSFHWYRRSLLASIAICFCAPFITLLFPVTAVSLVIIAVQALCVLWLIIEMLGVFQMVQEYYNPHKLYYRIHIPDEYKEVDTKRREELLCLVDLARYACRRNSFDVYNLCKSQFAHLINLEESKVGEKRYYNISLDLFWALRQIADYSKDNKNRYFYNDNIAAQSFYNSFFDYTIGPKTYESLWTSACFVAEGGSDEWFRQQWSNADQYYTYHYELNPNRDDGDRVLFREHHYMLGVMALFYQRYDWLRIVLFHTHSTPAKYPLVPSTFSAVIDAIRHLEAQRMNVWQLTQKYQMKGLFANVNSDDKLLDYAYRYAALLLIRLFSVNDYNITYSDPMQTPYLNPKASFYEMKKELELIDILRWHIATWYKEDNLKRIDLPVSPQQNEVEALLNQYKVSIESQVQYKEAHPVLDKDKMEGLKPLLINADNQIKPSYPIHAEDVYDDKPITISIAERLDNMMSPEGGYRDWSNWPNVMVSSLNHKIEAYYDGLLVYVNCDIYIVNEQNVFKALELLQPGKDDVIMSMGIYLPQIDMVYYVNPKLKYNGIYDCYYEETEIISRTSNQSSIIVIQRDQLPSISFLSPSADMTALSMMELADSQKHLCSNIDQVIADGKPQPVIKLAKNIRGHIPETAKGIRLVVKKNVDDTQEMARLESEMKKKKEKYKINDLRPMVFTRSRSCKG